MARRRGQLPPPPFKSWLEVDYAGVLNLAKRAGLLVEWEYEGPRCRCQLAPGVVFTDDFWVRLADGHEWVRAGETIEQLHQVKGRWWPKDRLAWRIAAANDPARTHKAVTYKKGRGWVYETYRRRGGPDAL